MLEITIDHDSKSTATYLGVLSAESRVKMPTLSNSVKLIIFSFFTTNVNLCKTSKLNTAARTFLK